MADFKETFETVSGIEMERMADLVSTLAISVCIFLSIFGIMAGFQLWFDGEDDGHEFLSLSMRGLLILFTLSAVMAYMARLS